MAQRELYLLGSPRLEVAGEVIHIPRRKTTALLAHLAMTDRRQPREALTLLLWPDDDATRASANFRRTLSLVNRILGSSGILADRETVGLDPDLDLWLDVATFRQKLAISGEHSHGPGVACAECVAALEEAVTLYRNDFLAGFTLGDSAGFDEWQLFETQRLRDELSGALARLSTWYGEQGADATEKAFAYARRWLALDPLNEPAHRQLMRLYARSGQRSAALRQYQLCVRALEEELAVGPSAETTALGEQIRAMTSPELPRSDEPRVFGASVPLNEARLPAFLDNRAEPPIFDRRVFVGREAELARLDVYVEAALAGQGQVAFVVGGPGRGKTSLMRTFAERAMAAHPDLLVLSGACNAYSGVGDAYLPFREVLGMLTGDVESRWRAGGLSTDHAQRVWSALSTTLPSVVAHGPHVVGTLVLGAGLLSRAEKAGLGQAPWMAEMHTLVQRSETGGLEQQALYQQVTNTLQAVAAVNPLILVLDDLQWADQGSIGLLFHLGRRLAGSRILVLGAYRPEEVAAGRRPGGAPEYHPLTKTLNEFRRDFGDVWIDLREADEAGGRQFVDALVDTEDNRLGQDFREAMAARTGGHALFTVELLRELQTRGDLTRDTFGAWVAPAVLDWRTVPARVEAVIEERLGRLTAQQHDLLAVASVEGEIFTAEVVADVQGVSPRVLLHALQDLAARHRLIHEVEEITVEGRYMSRFKFSHALFQEHLGGELTAGERRLLHGDVAAALERLYGSAAETVAVQLAYHYDAAGNVEKAADYAVLAGNKARASHADAEAKRYYERALEKLDGSVDTQWCTRRSLEALTGLGCVCFQLGEVPRAGEHFRAASDLGRASGMPAEELALLHYRLAQVLYWQERYEDRHRLGQEGLALFGEDQTSLGAVLLRHVVATDFKVDSQLADVSALDTGKAVLALPYVEELAWVYGNLASMCLENKDVVSALAWIEELRAKATQFGDLQGLESAYDQMSGVLWLIGDIDGCIRRQHERLDVAVRIGDVKGECCALNALACDYFLAGDVESTTVFAAKNLQLAQRLAYRPYIYYGYVELAWSAVCREDWPEATRLFLLAEEVYREDYNRVSPYGLGLACLGTGDRVRARELFEALFIAMAESEVTDRPQMFIPMLAATERAFDDPPAFRVWCEHFRAEHPGSIGFLSQWFLMPTDKCVCDQPPDFADEFTALSSLWAWEDALGGSTHAVGDGLMITALNGRTLQFVNLSAPRMMLSVPPKPGGTIAQVTCEPALDDRPAHGGLLLWQDRENYLWLEVGRFGESVVGFGGCLANRDTVIGRGLLPDGAQLGGGPCRHVTLRLERSGACVRAYCSLDGEAWFSVGQAEFPVGGALQIGVHAIGQGEVYSDLNPCIEGTAIRFRAFKLWTS